MLVELGTSLHFILNKISNKTYSLLPGQDSQAIQACEDPLSCRLTFMIMKFSPVQLFLLLFSDILVVFPVYRTCSYCR